MAFLNQVRILRLRGVALVLICLIYYYSCQSTDLEASGQINRVTEAPAKGRQVPLGRLRF